MTAKLFLGGLSPNTTTEAVSGHFGKYGSVIDAVVMYKDGKHRGFGFVTFDDVCAAEVAFAEEQVLDGRAIDVKRAVPQGEAPPPRLNGNGNAPFAGGGLPVARGGPIFGVPSSGPPVDKVFIGGLAQTTTEEMIRDYFSQYGQLVDAVVMKDRGSQRSRGFGFVQYDSTAPVDQVIADYANHQIDGKWIEVKKAVPQDQGGQGLPPAGRGFGGFNGSFAAKGGAGGVAMWCGGAPPRAAPVRNGPYPGPYGAQQQQNFFGGGGSNPYGAYPSYQNPAAGRGAAPGIYVKGAMGRGTFRRAPY